jgi:phosphoribosylformylglycinamidine synthase
VKLDFDLNEDVAAPFVKKKRAQPRVAILREQGVNGEVEMAAAFARAGFTPVDVHMSDILAGRVKLKAFKGLAACGGFSYGDVLGAGGGWAASILHNERARDEFQAFFERPDSFALGVCNGCQMMSRLKDIIPGAEHWPRFERNLSEQFEARFVMVEVPETPSILFDGMAGSRMPIVVAHGEGRAVFDGKKPAQGGGSLPALRGQPGARDGNLPDEPQRLPQGHHRPDHPGRPLHHHDAPPGTGVPRRAAFLAAGRLERNAWREDGPWLRLFRNARKWVG